MNRKEIEERNKKIVEDLKKLDENGNYKYTQQEIANKYNISKTTVWDVSKKYNLPPRENKSKCNINDIIKDLQELDENGNYKYTQQEIADRYGYHCRAINNIASENNIKRISKYNKNSLIKDLQELDENGNYKYTQQEIANKYNISIDSLGRIIKKYKLSRSFYLDKETELKIVNDLKEVDNYGKYNYLQRDIIEKYKITPSILKNIVIKYNLKRINRIPKYSMKLINLVIEDLLELDENGKYKYTYDEIANKNCVNIYTISKLSKQYRDKLYDENLVIKDLQELDENGNLKYTQKEIANKYNLHHKTISNIILRNNLDIKYYSKYNKDDIIKDLQELDDYNNCKYSYEEISKKYNVSYSIVRHLAERNNLTRRNSKVDRKMI